MHNIKTTAIGLAVAILSGISANAATVRVPFAMSSGTSSIQSYAFDSVGLGQYVYATFTYKNQSAKELTILSKVTEGAADLNDTTCGNTLAPQETCEVTVGLSVTQLGAVSGSVKFTTDQYANPDVFAVSATGISASGILTVSPGDASFTYNGDEKLFTVTNPRKYPVSIDAITSSNAYWGLTANNCSGELSANSSCTIKVRYNATRSGKYTSTLKISSQSMVIASTAMTGSLQYGAPALSQTSINAPALFINQPYTSSLVLTNTGAGIIKVLGTLFEKESSALQFTSDTCTGVTLTTGQSCVLGVKVQFSEEGSVQTNVGFKLSNANTDYVAVGLFAAASSAKPVLLVDPVSLDFGTVGTGTVVTKPINVYSTGNSPVTVSAITLNGSGSAAFKVLNGANCIGDLSAGNQCSFNVTYTGQGADSKDTATISVASNSTTASSIVNLSGSTANSALTISPATESISGAEGQTYVKDFSVVNSSAAVATISAVSTSNSAYTLSGSCTTGLVLQPTQSCVVRATLSTAKAGTGTATVTVKYDTTKSVTANVSHTITANTSTPLVSDIVCPTISAAGPGVSVYANAGDNCSLTIKNVGLSNLYLPNSGIQKISGTDFSATLSTSVIKAGYTGYTILPNASLTIPFSYKVPNSAGAFGADYTITLYSDVSDKSTAVTFNKTASVTVLPIDVSIQNLSCPASTYVTQPVTCFGTLVNKSLSTYSSYPVGTNILPNAQQLALGYSQATLDGVSLTTKLGANSQNFKPTTQFKWAPVANTGTTCSSGSLLKDKSCLLSFTFTPSVAGTYSIPVYAVTGTNPSTWISANNNVSVIAKPADNNLIVSSFACNPAYAGQTATCTAVVTNPASALKAIVPPAISIAGDAASIVLKSTSGVPAVSHTCGTSILVGKSCNMTISYRGATAGDYVGNATFTSGTLSAVNSFVAKVLPPALSFSAFNCPSGATGTNIICTSSLTNNMTVPVTVSTLSHTGSGQGYSYAKTGAWGSGTVSYTVVSGATTTTVNSTIPAGATVPVTMQFTGGSKAAGTYSTSVTANTSAYGSVTAGASTTITAYPAATGSLSAFTCPTLNYGQTGTCSAVLTNMSENRPLSITNIQKTATSAFGTLTHTCGNFTATLAPLASCTISVPVNVINAGAYSTAVTVTTNPVLTQSAKVVINGVLFSVIAPAAVRTAVNTEVQQTTTFRNENAFDVTLPANAVTVSNTAFTIKANTCSGKVVKAGQTCLVTTAVKSSVLNTFTAKVSLATGGTAVSAELKVTVSTPKLTIAVAYPTITKNSGFRSLSGNWYSVTNDSFVSQTFSKITPKANTLVFADKSIAGSCYLGLSLNPGQSCLILEQENLTDYSKKNVVVAGASSSVITATSGLTGSWNPAYNIVLGTALFDKTTYSNIPNKAISGNITFNNTTTSPVSGLVFTKNTATTNARGNLTINAATCATVNPGESCTVTFTYTGATVGTSTLGVSVSGKFARMINGKQQGWGESTIVANSPSATIGVVAPTGSLVVGHYDSKTANRANSDATSVFTNSSKFAYLVTNVAFTPGLDQSFVSSDCVGRYLAVGESCNIVTRWTPWKNRTESEWGPGTITVTVESNYNISDKIRPFRTPWSGGGEDSTAGNTDGPITLKRCMFAQSAPVDSDNMGCMRRQTILNAGVLCYSPYNYNDWLNFKFFNGFIEKYNNVTGDRYIGYPYADGYGSAVSGQVLPAIQNLTTTQMYSMLTWKNSGMKVTPVIWKSPQGYNYSFGVRPIAQWFVNGVWSDVSYSANSSGIKANRNAYWWGAPGKVEAVIPGVSGSDSSYYSTSMVPYDILTSSGTGTSNSSGVPSPGAPAYSYRITWYENTPGPNCHMPGTVLVR